jgi:hypothetical protein
MYPTVCVGSFRADGVSQHGWENLSDEVRLSTTADLLTSMHERGVRIWTDNGQLRYRTSGGGLQPQHLDLLRDRKIEIIELLEQEKLARTVPLEPRSSSTHVPLTPIQQLLWGMFARDGQSLHPRVNELAVRIHGRLNVEALRRSLEFLVQRHESLRTRIVVVDGIPTQQIDAAQGFRLQRKNLSGMPPDRAEERTQLLTDELLEEKIDLSTGPLFAARLIRLHDDDYVLVMSLDHMITDFVSKKILHEELWTVYGQAVRGQTVALPKAPLQVGDYAVWLQRMYPMWAQRHRKYWQDRLANAVHPRFPIDHDPAEQRPAAGAELKMAFGGPLTSRLLEFARRERVLPALVPLTLYVAAVARWCEQNDLTVVLVENGRHRPELVNVVGWLATVLHLRIQRAYDATLIDLLRLVNQEFLAASFHQDFNWIVASNPEFLMELHFNWRSTQVGEWTLNPLEATEDALAIQPFAVKKRAIPQFRLGVFFEHAAREVTARLVYRTDLFEPATIARFASGMRSLAEELVQQP